MSVSGHGLAPLLSVFGDESGSFRKGDWQIIGMILTLAPNARRAELASLRDRYDFRRELKYSDTDALSLPYALAVIDWFLESEMRFHCIAKSGDAFDLSGFSHRYGGMSPEALAFNFTYKELLRHNLPAGFRVVVTVDQQARTANNNLLDYLKTDMPMIRDVIDGDSKRDDLLQVADLLTGCIYGALTATRHSRKLSLSETFLRGCGMPSPRHPPSKVTRHKVNVWIYRAGKGTSPRTP